jgi:homeobox protein HoxA/B2
MCETMRGKQHVVEEHEGEEEDEEGEEEEYLGLKSGRGPEGLECQGGQGGGFWMAAVSAAAGGGGGGIDMMPGAAESGFISSQPSIAEFILPHHMGPAEMTPSPQQYQPPGMDQQQPVQEYPWMKEKKTARKNNQQGMSLQYSSLYHFYRKKYLLA